MLCKDLKVVNLNITEDNYDSKALFRLCSEDHCFDVDLAALSEKGVIENIKKEFALQEPNDEVEKIIMDKVIEASKIESRFLEGEGLRGDQK